ncbi:MAG TPA: GNAT family N-acetyltransferase [Thermoanaerobaculia bacterium]
MSDIAAGGVAVRAVRPDESGLLPLLVDLQVRMAEETEGLALDRATVARGMAAVLADPAKGEYWVAVRQDGAAETIVGMLLVTFEWSDWRDATVLWVQSVYVVPEARGQGVYRLLYENLKRRVERNPRLAGIRLYVDRRNTAAQRVYERLGMTREHYELFEWLKG